MPGWGRCVEVASNDDIDSVHRLVTAPGRDRRAVVFCWQTKSKRRALVDALEATGLVLRPFDDTDRAASSFHPSFREFLLMVPGLPYILVMRLRGRKTQMYEVTRRGS